MAFCCLTCQSVTLFLTRQSPLIELLVLIALARHVHHFTNIKLLCLSHRCVKGSLEIMYIYKRLKTEKFNLMPFDDLLFKWERVLICVERSVQKKNCITFNIEIL